MSKTVTITRDGDGSMTIVKSDDGVPVPPAPPGSQAGVPFVIRDRHHNGFDGGVFVLGVIVGMIVLLLIQRLRRLRRHRPADFARDRDRDSDRGRMESEVAALARRTATLETIVTDPAQRTAREIDALR